MGFLNTGLHSKSCLFLLSLFILSACQEQEFYEKEFLEGVGVPDEVKQGREIHLPNAKNNPIDDIRPNEENPTSGPGHQHAQENIPPREQHEQATTTGPLPQPTPPSPPIVIAEPVPTPAPGPEVKPENPGEESNSGPVCNAATLVPQVDTFWQNNAADTTKLDLLWVVDNSGSMRDEQDNLARNFQAFIQKFIQKNIDFAMGITTTDMDHRPGEMIGSFASMNATAAVQNPEAFIQYFQQKIRVGIWGSGYEKGLAAADTFLTRYNSHFVRENSLLVTIFVSDEEDQSDLDVEQYLQNYSSYKAQAGYFKAYSVVKINGVEENQGKRYQQLSQLTSGLTADIDGDFHTILDQISNQIIHLLKSFPLSQAPFENKVVVEVDGVPTLDHWSFDTKSRSVTFTPGHEPAAGSKITVNYNVCQLAQ